MITELARQTIWDQYRAAAKEARELVTTYRELALYTPREAYGLSEALEPYGKELWRTFMAGGLDRCKHYDPTRPQPLFNALFECRYVLCMPCAKGDDGVIADLEKISTPRCELCRKMSNDLTRGYDVVGFIAYTGRICRGCINEAKVPNDQ